MGIEADTKSPWNEGHIGTGRGYDGVTDSSIGKLSYRDAQCGASIGQVGYNDAQCAVNIGNSGYMYAVYYMSLFSMFEVFRFVIRQH